MARLALHAAVAATVALFVALGLWQLGRHNEREELNRLVGERAGLPPAPLEAVLGADDAAYRPVSVEGAYRTSEELLLTGRTLDGRPGHHVLTPLESAGLVVLVDRGWIPFALDTPPVAEAAPPEGPVVVTGILMPGEPPAPFGQASEGRALRLTRVDLDRIDAQVEGDLAPHWVLLSGQRPAQPGDLPRPAPPPEPDAGPHLAYAGQWFLFALVAAAGYPLLLRRMRPGAGGNVSVDG